MSAIVESTAPIPVKIGVITPPTSQPVQTNAAARMIKKITVDFTVKTSYNMSVEVAPRFPSGASG